MAKIQKKVVKPKLVKACDLNDIEASRTSYEERKSKEQAALANKPPNVDAELIEHILDIWGKFYDKIIDHASTDKEEDHQGQRTAAYLTMAYFICGGKMPPEKFYALEYLNQLIMK
jgi:hypothetical protein